MASELELKLRVSANAANAIKSFGDLKRSLGAIGEAVSAAQTKTADLAREFKANQQRSDELRLQYALGQRELARLAETTSKTSPEYRALSQEIKQIGDELKTSERATKQSERAFEAAKRQTAQLMQQLDAMRQSVHQYREALRSQGVDVGHLAAEYTRLHNAAQLAEQTQARQGRIDAARETLGLSPHADTRSRIDAVHAALEELRASGQLTFAEMAQAELHADEMARQLAHDFNGVGDTLASLQADVIEFGAAVAAVYGTVDQAMRFESGFAGVAKVVDATQGELAALSDQLLAMTRELPTAAADLLDVGAQAGSLGIAQGEIDDFVEGTMKMSVAFQMQADATAEYAAGIKNAFGLSVPEVMRLGDAVNTLGNQYAATENDILNVNARSAATAKTFGLTAEQTAALGTTLLSLKQPPEVAATSINSLLGRLQAARVQGKDFQQALQAIGLDANQLAAGISANPQQALDTFLAKLAEIGQANPTNLAEITNKLVGNGSDSVALQQLVQNLKTYRQATATATDSTQTAGAVEREFAAQMATTEAQVTLTKNAVGEFATRVGMTLLPAVQGGASAVREFFLALADAAKSNPELTKLLAMLGPLIAGAGLLNGVGLRLAVMWASLRTAFIAGGSAAVALSGGLGGVLGLLLRLIGGPIGLAILAALKLADAWGQLKDKQIQFGDSTVTVSEMVQAAWGMLTGFLSGNLAKMGADLQGWADKAVNLVKSVVGVFNGLGQSIGVALAIFVEEIATSFRHAVSLAKAAAQDIKAAFTRLDFSASNTVAQWQANAQENKTIEQRRGESPRRDAFVSGYMDVYKGDALSQGATQLGNIIDAAVGVPIKESTKGFVNQVEAEIMRGRMVGNNQSGDENGLQSSSKKLTSGGSPAPASSINWDGFDSSGGKSKAGSKEKAHEQTARAEIDALEQGLSARKLAFEKSHLLLEFSKKEEKAYWDEVITNFKGSSSTLSQLKEKSARLDVDIQRDAAQQQQAWQAELSQMQRESALSDLDFKRQMADQELELGKITQAEHLARLKELAAEELALRLKILEDRRKLHLNDPVEQAKISAEEQQVMIKFRGDWSGLESGELKAAKNDLQTLFEPLQNALDQSINGILTGQQTIANAARNAAQSVVLSYIQQSIKIRAIKVQDWLFEHTGMAKLLNDKKQFDLLGTVWDAVMWARKRVRKTLEWTWEISGLAGAEARKRAIKSASSLWEDILWAGKQAKMAALWVWETLGFAAKETAKTGAQLAGDQIRVASSLAATGETMAVETMAAETSIVKKAGSAAASVYESVAEIPIIGWILAPIAAAAAFMAVMAFGTIGSAKGGEYMVTEDGKPYKLHERESVLPAGVADNFRTVVDIVRQHVAPTETLRSSDTAATETGTGAIDRGEGAAPTVTTLPSASAINQIVQGLKANGQLSTETLRSSDAAATETGTGAIDRGEGAAPTVTILPSASAINQIVQGLKANGQLSTDWHLPQAVVQMVQDSQHSAQVLAQNAYQHATQNSAARTENHYHNTTQFSPVYNNDFIDAAGAQRFAKMHARATYDQLKRLDRRFVGK